MGMRLDFHDVSVQIENKWILQSVSGFAEPGKLLAVMGPSGKLFSKPIIQINLPFT